MKGQKIMCMKSEHLVFVGSVSLIPFPLRKLPESFGLMAFKSFYPHEFNTGGNLNYIAPILDDSYFRVNEMGDEERRECFAW